MRPKREISLYHAQRIVDTYPAVPLHREEQIKLIQLRGYRQLNRQNFDDCPDNQIHTVACRILNNCYQITQGCTLLQATHQSRCQKNYENQLYHTFNIPRNDSDPNYIPFADLERLLLD